MNGFTVTLTQRIESYVALQRTLGYAFHNQAAILHAFRDYAFTGSCEGPLTQQMALDFVCSRGLTPNGRAVQYAVLRRFATYLAIYDSRTQVLDPRALPPRSRAIPPARILTDQELEALVSAAERLPPRRPLRARTLATLVGLLASTGLRSGEALRLNRADVDLTEGLLQVWQSKFRKDRLVPVHITTLAALREYACQRDTAFPHPKCPAFFVSLRGRRLSATALYDAWHQACALAGIAAMGVKALRPHDLRHRFAVARLVTWHRQHADVQALLPVLATYLGHSRYSDTAYYVTGTAELLGLAAERAFGAGGAS